MNLKMNSHPHRGLGRAEDVEHRLVSHGAVGGHPEAPHRCEAAVSRNGHLAALCSAFIDLLLTRGEEHLEGGRVD